MLVIHTNNSNTFNSIYNILSLSGFAGQGCGECIVSSASFKEHMRFPSEEYEAEVRSCCNVMNMKFRERESIADESQRSRMRRLPEVRALCLL